MADIIVTEIQMSNPLYSLLIVPEGNPYKVLKKIIEELSKKYQAPVFEPHLTLLGDIEGKEKTIIEKTKELASKLEPFQLTLGKVEFSTTYHQCVFVRVNPTASLMDAYMQARIMFGEKKDQVFMPHISLVYGNFAMPQREQITKEVALPALAFSAESIRLIRVSTDPGAWKNLGEFEF